MSSKWDTKVDSHQNEENLKFSQIINDNNEQIENTKISSTFDLSESQESNKDSSNSKLEEEIYTPDEVIDYYGFGLFQVFIMFICGIIWTADSMEIMLLSFLIPAIEKDWNLSSAQSSAIGSVVFFGMIAGAFSWGIIADKFGRKIAILSMIIFTLIFGMGSSIAPNYWVLLICRACVGFGVTGSGVAYSLFSEFLPSSSRGIYLLIIEGFWTIGVVFESLLAWITLYDSETYHPFRLIGGWRVLLLLTNFPLLFVLFLVPFLPESHRFLILKNKTREAKQIYHSISFWNCKTPLGGDPISKEIPTGRITELFKPVIRRVIATLIALWICSAFIYYGAVILTPEYFRFVNDGIVDEFSVYKETLITSFAELPGLLFSATLINIIGRKKTLFVTFSFAAIGIGLLGIFSNRVMLVLSAILTRAMVMGASSTVWALTTESLPTSLRNIGLGVSSSSSRVFGSLTPFFSSFFLKINPLIPILSYIIVSVIGALLSILFPFETKGKQLVDTVERLQIQY